jgi:hypothetical protein
MEARVVEKIRQVLKAPKPILDMEIRFTSKDGREWIANTSAVCWTRTWNLFKNIHLEWSH